MGLKLPTKARVTPFRRFVFFAIGDLAITLAAVAGTVILVTGAVGVVPVWAVPYAIVTILVRTTLLASSGVYRVSWRYLGLPDLILLGVTFGVSFATIGAANVLWGFPGLSQSAAWAPIALEHLLSLCGIGLFRVTRRLVAKPRGGARKQGFQTAILVGAGQAGEHVLRSLRETARPRWDIVGVLDDDPLAQKMTIHGYPVLGMTADLKEAIDSLQPEAILIAIPSAASPLIRQLASVANQSGVTNIMVFPHVSEILNGRVDATKLRSVNLGDLLGRHQVAIDEDQVRDFLQGERVLVTGAAGTIGSEICRQLLRFGPAAIAPLDQDESRLHEIHLELERLEPGMEVTPFLTDVAVAEELRATFVSFQPTVVFHAAAYKHVPVMERQPEKALQTNIRGTLNVCRIADELDVQHVVNISTDKAVAPSSVMGASKLVGENIVRRFAAKRNRRYVVVRFGNVLGSRGSVIPLFERQIAEGGPVTVTHRDMERYFMLTSEAVLLVFQAAADNNGQGGDVFVLDMDKPVRILDMAEQMIRLKGLQPYEDIQIVFSGVRPGEKLTEVLLALDELTEPAGHPKIRKAKTRVPQDGYVTRVQAALDAHPRGEAASAAIEALCDGEARFLPHGEPQLEVVT